MYSLSWKNQHNTGAAISIINPIIQKSSSIPLPPLFSGKLGFKNYFPIDIQQLSAFSGSIVLELSQKELETLSTPLTLEVFSTRGKAQKIELKKDQIYGL